MKLLVAILQAEDADACSEELTSSGFMYTRLSSRGGFLDKEGVTILMGVAAERVDEACAIFRDHARERTRTLDGAPSLTQTAALFIPGPVDVQVGGATLFVVDMEQFIRL